MASSRLATLSILALAVIDKLGKIAATGTDPEANRERASSLRTRFIGEKDPASLVESSKLFLNETDNAFYQDYLVHSAPHLTRDDCQNRTAYCGNASGISLRASMKCPHSRAKEQR